MANDKKFECPKKNCGYVTPRNQNLKYHLKIHEPRVISCPDLNCSYTTNQKRHLKNHMWVHSGREKRFKCTFCPFTCHRSDELLVHVRVHTGETPFKCPEAGCNFQTKQRSHLKQHAKVHSGIRQFKCPFCTHATNDKRCFRNHLDKVHGEDSLPILSEPCQICPFPIEGVSCTHSIDMPFQCPHKRCKFRSRTQKKLTDHQLSHSVEKHLECPHSPCKFRTAHKRSLTVHIKLHEENPETFFQCPICPYKSRLKRYVVMHLKSGIHDEKRQRRFKCPEAGCNYSAFNNSKLTRHLESHNPEKSFKCPEPGCSYRTNQKELLRIHGKIHSGEKTWKCNFCQKTFRQSGSLASHIRTHTKETLFGCPETGCQFRANRNRSLSIHLSEVHWKIRPYQCPLCKYSATRKSTWKSHQRLIHGSIVQSSSFVCTVSGCGVVARNPKELAIHFTSRHNLPRVMVAREMV